MQGHIPNYTCIIKKHGTSINYLELILHEQVEIRYKQHTVLLKFWENKQL